MNTNVAHKPMLLIAVAMLAAIVPAIAQQGGAPTEIGGGEAISCRKSAETAPLSMERNNPTYAEGRSEASQRSSLPVWSGREGAENAAHCAAPTSEWRKNEAEGDREQKGRDEGLHGRSQGPARQVRAT